LNKRQITAGILIIGNEVLSGRTKDVNLQYLTLKLGEIGIQVSEARVVLDEEDKIISAVNHLRSVYDYLFTTGGIGPTHDDITSLSIAKAFGIGHEKHPEAEAILRSYYKIGDITEARLRMAELPVGAHLLYNPVSHAPGFCVENVYVLPGVPKIMQAIFEGFYNNLTGGVPILSYSISTLLGEGIIGTDLGVLQLKHPEVSIGSYPFLKDGKTGTSLVARHTDQVLLEQVKNELQSLIVKHGGDVLSDLNNSET